jgi:hypothetical protein
MKHLSILTLTMIALSSFMATTVQADSPHFVRGPTPEFDTSTGDYCVSFKEVGLGNEPITYTLTVGVEEFTFQCFTRHGNTPQGDPNGQSFSDQWYQPRSPRTMVLSEVRFAYSRCRAMPIVKDTDSCSN